MSEPYQRPPHRGETDRSLGAERATTDAALEKKRLTVEREADQVIARARDQADAGVKAARQQRDRASQGVAGTGGREEVERRGEDAVVRAERAVTDETLNREREARKKALAALLGPERADTDEALRDERAYADQAIDSRDTFLAVVSHDLRSLLGGIALNATMLVEHAPDDALGRKMRKWSEGIQRFVARTNRIVGDLVDVASIESGKLQIAPEEDNAVSLVRETMEAFRTTAAERRISLDAKILKEPMLASFDHERVLQVLANLLGNAIKFTPQGGQVTLLVQPVGGEVEFEVSDTGPGIPEDALEAVFERFHQAAARDRRGLGLGLFISKCLVEAHGGRIWARSSPGTGTTVCFTLPGSVADAHPD